MPYIPTMPKNRIFPALLFAVLVSPASWAQNLPAPSVSSPDAPAEPPTEAEVQLDAAIKQITALKSISADVAQKVEMLDQKFRVEGRYLKAPNDRVYLRLDVIGLPDAAGPMLQVCDGKTLWDYRKILESQSYQKLEVSEIFAKLRSPELDDAIRKQVGSQLGFSGPEELLAGLRRTVRFDQKESGTLDDKEVWVIRGTWKNRNGMLGPNQQPLPPTVGLPAYVPSLVTVYVGKNDGWPYKLVMVGKRDTVMLDNRKIVDGKPVGRPAQGKEKMDPTRIELTYANVKFNPELQLEEFVFEAPRDARVEDNTQAVATMLDQAIASRAAQKKAEAAKGDDPLLNQSIDVPKSSGAAAPPTIPTVGGAEPPPR